MARLLAVVMVAALVSGCGLWVKDTAEPPAPLPHIEAVVTPHVLWHRNVGRSGGTSHVQLSPYLTQDRIMVTDAQGRVSAWALEDGANLWRIHLQVPVTSGVNGGDGVVMVGTGHGEVIALDLEAGRELWRRRLSSEVMAVSAVEQGVMVARTNDGRLHALDVLTGEPRWLAGRTTPALSLRGAGMPLMISGRVLAGFDNGRLAMFGLTRGNVIWETALAVPSGRSELERMVDVDGALALAGGVVYGVAYQGRVAALGVADGRTLWQRELSSYRGVTVMGDLLLLTDAFGHVWALDRRNGATLWQQDMLRLRGVTLPVAVGEYVVVGDDEGYLHWLDPEDGTLVGRVRTDRHGIMGVPQVRADVVYVLGRGGNLSAVTLRSQDDS
ncbi:outer membrane protein assembly factor BamB [Ectothiorhodospira magna]|uniref:Outer membrane protein assembly factor BamB n=1 Tax=Ectothiorhodospira magna TaxID=867345 RepID=A0A1H8ZRR8_9GAMM|nr:outer membrane protein assembly factor BamB [Ectothiorhodospira magna]SEP67055.1 outer membrane protein assembly factor BamB [Ectothiorhodospira magna]